MFPINGLNHQVAAWLCVVLLPFLSMTWLLLLLALGLSSLNMLSLLLLSVFTSSMATLASKALILSGILPIFQSGFLLEFIQLLALCCWHWVILLSWVFLQLNLTFESATLSTGLLLLVRSGPADGSNLHIRCKCFLVNVLGEKGNYCIKIWCALTAVTAVDNLSHLVPFIRYQIFNPGSRPWYPYSMRCLRIIWYLICWATYFLQFHVFFFVICRHLQSHLGFWCCHIEMVWA